LEGWAYRWVGQAGTVKTPVVRCALKIYDNSAGLKSQTHLGFSGFKFVRELTVITLTDKRIYNRESINRNPGDCNSFSGQPRCPRRECSINHSKSARVIFVFFLYLCHVPILPVGKPLAKTQKLWRRYRVPLRHPVHKPIISACSSERGEPIECRTTKTVDDVDGSDGLGSGEMGLAVLVVCRECVPSGSPNH